MIRCDENTSVWAEAVLIVSAVVLVLSLSGYSKRLSYADWWYCFIYVLNFNSIGHDHGAVRFGSYHQQFWVLLQFPLHTSILLAVERQMYRSFGTTAVVRSCDLALVPRVQNFQLLASATSPSLSHLSTALSTSQRPDFTTTICTTTTTPQAIWQSSRTQYSTLEVLLGIPRLVRQCQKQSMISTISSSSFKPRPRTSQIPIRRFCSTTQLLVYCSSISTSQLVVYR